VSNSSRSCCTATCARSPLVDERAFRHVIEQNQQSIDATLHHTRGRCSPKASRQSSPNSGRTVSFVRAHSTHRDHFVQTIVIARSSDRDRSEATLGTSVL
jgi:hypothetical protein